MSAPDVPGAPEASAAPDVRETRGEHAGEVIIKLAFTLSILGAIGLGIVYWRGGQPQLEGTLIAVVAGSVAVALITWSHRLLPNAEEVEDRPDAASELATRSAFNEDLRGDEHLLSRRRVLRRFLYTSLVAIGGAFLFPLRSLGPRPSDSALDATPWRDGLRVVTEAGQPVRAAEVPTDGLVTIFPDGAVDSESGQAVLVRVDPGLIQPLPGRESWTPDGLVAYSKVCTHAGCPVGLYEAASHQLLCPCHQSTFDVLDGARPVFGPAATMLPQLPLAIDTNGFIIATGDFSAPPGPSFWDRKQ